MSKRIAYCFDGTWDVPMSGTNVNRLFKALLVNAEQVTGYDVGVGADATGLDHIIQGAFGITLPQQTLQGYTQIAHLYEPGDSVYIFGFSRGAYTARCVAGMIAACGLPSGSFTDDCVQQAFSAYRDPTNRAKILATLGSCNLVPNVDIAMVGVWDTVGSLGIPAIVGQVDQDKYGFLDTTLHPNVKRAYQCLAIDEHRAQFPATLWTGTPAAGQTLEQVWFSGCHGDVGGGTVIGTADTGTRLCDVTFAYMIQKAQAAGLTFDPAAIAPFAKLPADDALDIIRDSWKPFCGKPNVRPIAPGSSISNSVPLRIQYALTYSPANLTIEEADGSTPPALGDGYTLFNLVDETLPL
jgi:uncharacterized protein (DUF2235 family)